MTVGLPEEVIETRKLAAAMTRPGDDVTRLYLIESRDEPWPAGSICRAGGPPIGVDEQTRPRYQGSYMHHVITIDLELAPELRSIKLLAGARAVAVFISNAMENYAFEQDTDETAVVALTEQDLARGEWAGPPVDDPAPRAMDLHPVDVPARLFAQPDFDQFGESPVGPLGGGYESPDMEKLASSLLSADRCCGSLILSSCDDETRNFVAQISEFIVDLNLGDAGTMYIFADRAFWDCL